MSVESMKDINRDINEMNAKIAIGVRFADSKKEAEVLDELKIKMMMIQKDFVKAIESIMDQEGVEK